MSATSHPIVDRKRATATELAEHLNTSPQVVNGLRRKGIIPTVVSEGKLHRYDIDEVDAVLKRRADAKRKEAGV